MTRSTIEGVGWGLTSETLPVGPAYDASALVTVSDSIIRNNELAWYQVGGGSVIKSLGNNQISDNAGASIGVLTTTALQ